MSRWFRHYAGMMRDDKLVRVAIRSGQPVERVVWVWGAILESAAEIDDEGRYDLAADEAAYFLRTDEADVLSVIAGLQASGRLDQDRVVNWGHRQFASDKSKDRQAAYRERQKAGKDAVRSEGSSTEGGGDGGVTSLSRHGDGPETETELDTEDTPLVPLAGGRRGKISIPADWVAPPVSELPPRSRACAEQWTDASYQTEAEAFVCYWRSERKMKANWRDTWCNRIIARHEAVMRAQKFGNAPPAGKQKALTADEWETRAEQFDRINMNDNAEECRRKAAELRRAA